MFKCKLESGFRQLPMDTCNSSHTQIDYQVVQNANTTKEKKNRASITVNIPEMEKIGVHCPGYFFCPCFFVLVYYN